jgi:hypothetical protein
MPKKSKLNSLTQTHGKVEDFQPTTLDQIFGGFNRLSTYGTLEEGEYKGRLLQMTRADLEAHAREKGCLIVEDSNRLREMLMKQFRAYVSFLKKPAPLKPTSGKIPKAVQDVLYAGR